MFVSLDALWSSAIPSLWCVSRSWSLTNLFIHTILLKHCCNCFNFCHHLLLIIVGGTDLSKIKVSSPSKIISWGCLPRCWQPQYPRYKLSWQHCSSPHPSQFSHHCLQSLFRNSINNIFVSSAKVTQECHQHLLLRMFCSRGRYNPRGCQQHIEDGTEVSLRDSHQESIKIQVASWLPLKLKTQDKRIKCKQKYN